MKRYRPLWANEKKIFFLRRNIPFSGLNSVQSKTKQKWSLPKEIILWVSARWLVFDMSCKENIYNFSKMTLCPLPVYFYFPKMKAKFQFGRLCWCACLVVLIVSDSVWFYALQPTSLLCPWDSPGKNTRGGCHALLQGIFPTCVSYIAGMFFKNILGKSWMSWSYENLQELWFI